MKQRIEFVSPGLSYDQDIIRVTEGELSRCETRAYWIDHITHHGRYKLDNFETFPRLWRGGAWEPHKEKTE